MQDYLCRNVRWLDRDAGSCVLAVWLAGGRKWSSKECRRKEWNETKVSLAVMSV